MKLSIILDLFLKSMIWGGLLWPFNELENSLWLNYLQVEYQRLPNKHWSAPKKNEGHSKTKVHPTTLKYNKIYQIAPNNHQNSPIPNATTIHTHCYRNNNLTHRYCYPCPPLPKTILLIPKNTPSQLTHNPISHTTSKPHWRQPT
jgi:hypothetical protein